MIGEASVALGAGRAKKGDPVDHAVGIKLHHKVGDHIQRGEPLFTIHANDAKKQAEALESIRMAFGWSDTAIARLPLFYE